MKPFTHTSCIILSAGNSLRMGEHKALLKFDKDASFIQKITETYLLAGIEQVIVIINPALFNLINKNNLKLSEKVHLVINDKPELGRFYSLQTGIKHLKSGNSCFFQNIDNPFTTNKLLRELIIFKDEADVIMPAFEDRSGHPALISSFVVQRIYSEIDPEIRIDVFLKQFTQKKIGIPEPNILLNLNLPEDYLKAGFGDYIS